MIKTDSTPPKAPLPPSKSFAAVAPARVNLLGEHTDYTGGLVMPFAIPFTTTAHITPAQKDFRFTSDFFPGAFEFSETAPLVPQRNWTDYPVGVLHELQLLGIHPPPFHLHLAGDVPFGAGLSSSASVEVASCLAMLHHANASLSGEEVALLCRRAENNFVGSPCGIMDQFVIATAKADHALLLHTSDLRYEHLPLAQGALRDTRILICNSAVKHSVATGEYGTRRLEAEAGQDAIRRAFPASTDLGKATLEQLDAVASSLSKEAYKRTRHIVSENARVLAARRMMLQGDPVELGALMLEAHRSMRDDFEASCEEIDFLVDTAGSLEGCFGARMTGGGFGGCTVNLVAAGHVESFTAALQRAYKERYGIDADVYLGEAVDGAMARLAQENEAAQ